MGFWNKLFRKASRTDAYVYGEGFVGAVYPKYDYEKIATEAYCQNTIAYRSIYLIASAAAGVPWQLFQDTGNPDIPPEVIETGDIYNLLYRPNPQQGWSALIQSLLSFYLLSGNAYVERIALKTGMAAGTPKELYSLRPDRIKVLKNASGITGYQYGDGARKVIYEVNPRTGQSDILHLKTFNPINDFYGWAPTMSAAGHIDNSNDALTWNRSMLKNGARPSTLVTMERSMSEEQYNRFKEQLNNKYGGPVNAGKTIMIDNLGEGKVNVSPWGWNPKELDYMESSREDARRIALAYGVPPMLLGIPGDNTYSNYQSAREAFYEETVLPLLYYLRDELNNWLFQAGSREYLGVDLSKVEALAEKRDALWDRAEKATTLTINEKRELQGFPPIPGGDVIFMGAGMVPVLGDDAMGIDDMPAEEPLTEEEAEIAEEEARRLLLDSGYPQEIVDQFIGLKEEWHD
jgi:HK97 family phage portal protein